MTPFRYPKLFVSATSRGLKPLRLAVSEQLKAKKYEVVVQEEFSGTYQQIKDMIRDEIAPCDAVVLLVGPAYGFEATDWPAGLPRCSYTQLEYELAVELKLPVYRYLASEKYPFVPFDVEPAEHQQRQRDYVARLKAQDHIWYEFDTREQVLALLEKTRFHNRVKPNLPFDSIGTLFKGREDELKAVRKSLLTRPAHATAVTSKQAIHGLGGVGKTRFAVEYAHRHGTEYSARLYANADTPSALASNMAALVHVLDLPEKEDKEQPKQLEAVERWLRMHAGWLLILDNVDTAEAQAAVNAAFKNLTTGHVLITSRLTDWGAGVNAVELDVLSLPASTEFLLERTERKAETPTAPARQLTDTDPDEAKALAEELGRLALALEQAGAYICANRITFADYRQRLTEIERDVLTWFDPAVMKYPKSVAVTWQASVRKLHEEGRHLLNLLCWLAPDPIPVALIKTAPKELPHFPIEDRERALRDLSAYSLAKWNTTGDAVTVHRLVQDVTRTRLAEPTKTETLTDMLGTMEVFTQPEPQDTRTWGPVYQMVSSHLERLTHEADMLDIIDPAVTLRDRLATFLYLRADYETAERLQRRLVEICWPGSSAEPHPLASTVLNNLGMTCKATDRLVDAERFFRLALALDEERLGPWAPDIATLASNLGTLLHSIGKLDEAEVFYRRALSVTEKCCGRDHPLYARELNNLGELLRGKGDVIGAEDRLRESLRVMESNFGYDHPEVATVLSNLGTLCAQTRRLAEAALLLERAVAIKRRILGPQHPDLAVALVNLAGVNVDAGKLTEGDALFREASAMVGTILGIDHPLFREIARKQYALARRVEGVEQETQSLGTAISSPQGEVCQPPLQGLPMNRKNNRPDSHSLAPTDRSRTHDEMSSDQLRLLTEPVPFPADSVSGHPVVALFVTGIVNPFGPTLTAYVAVNTPAEVVWPVVRVMLNPFSQSVELVGEVSGVLRFRVELLASRLAGILTGSCPSLLLPNADLSAQEAIAIHAGLIRSYHDARRVMDSVRRHFGSPGQRVSEEMKAAVERLTTDANVNRPEVESDSPLTEAESVEFAGLLLSDRHTTAELDAFLYAWRGSIQHYGQGLQSLGFEGFCNLFRHLACFCRFPNLD